MEKEIITVDDVGIKKDPNLQKPGDKITQMIMPKGDIVTRLDTEERKATHRQYMKKDGTPGKQTIIFMQPDGRKK